MGEFSGRRPTSRPALAHRFGLHKLPLHTLPLAPRKQGLIYFWWIFPTLELYCFQSCCCGNTWSDSFITTINTLNDFGCQRPLFFQGLLLDKWSQLLKKCFFCCFNFWHALRKLYVPYQCCVWYFIHVGKQWLTWIKICEHKQRTLSKSIPHSAIVFACSYNLFAMDWCNEAFLWVSQMEDS